MPTTCTSSKREAELAENTGRQTVYFAVTADGGSNVHANGWTCWACDDTYDPHYRTGVPCRSAYWHAAHTVANWNTVGNGGAHLEIVDVPAGDPDQVAAAAREAISTTAKKYDDDPNECANCGAPFYGSGTYCSADCQDAAEGND